MAKKKTFGFKTPVRRTTKNITGNKVGGELTGGECIIKYMSKISLLKTKIFEFSVDINDAVGLFNSNIGVIAIGGYFISDNDIFIEFKIIVDDVTSKVKYEIKQNRFYSIGHDFEIDLNDETSEIKVSITFTVEKTTNVDYEQFSFGFVKKDEFIESEEMYRHFSNSKKTICYPEQFYFTDFITLPNSVRGSVIINKSCNRCQRYLPINPYNQRIQLAFSNHCTTKAPCTHKNFSNYTIKENHVTTQDLSKFEKVLDSRYVINDETITSYYGHQLECKACKKFFVNAALNHLRTSSQHREDSLRRRSFELLIRKLLGMKWIYHKFRVETGKEFDKEIWKKFDKKCFNCGKELKKASDMHLDHTMPLSYLYPIDETATCLCSTCNNQKSDIFPVDFYTDDKLIELSDITGIPIEILKSKNPNQKVIDKLKENVVWFVEEFLTHPEYVKEREGKKAADSILHSINKVLSKSDEPFDIMEKYKKDKSTNT